MKLWSVHDAARGFLSVALVLSEMSNAFPIAAQTPDLDGARGGDNKSSELPVGTVLPVSLTHGFSSRSAKAGQAITGRIMQEVPLPNGGNIPEGAKVLGTIVSVERAGSNNGGRISFRFDHLEIRHRQIPILINLRALAGFMEVQFAQTPEFSPGFGTPSPWVTTRQIGGDEVYGVGGPVTDQWSDPVGKAVLGGVLVHVRALPGTKCRGVLDTEDRLQALWVFSSDACGVYGMTGVTIAHAGRAEPTGEVILAGEQRDVLVRGGSGMLLRVVR
jgi:hypothetical protein